MKRSEELTKEFSEYAERLRTVRELSSPSVSSIQGPEDYSRLLLHNFCKIGELAGENRKMLDEILLPLLKEKAIGEEEAEELEKLNSLLIDQNLKTDLDTHLSEMISDRLAEREMELIEDEEAADPEKHLQLLDKRLEIVTRRLDLLINANKEEYTRLFNRGCADYEEILSYLDKQRFAELSEEARETVIINMRFGATIYSGDDTGRYFEKLMELKSVLQDPFYHQMLPHMDWEMQEFLLNEYIAEMSILDEPTREQNEAALQSALYILDIFKKDTGKYQHLFDESYLLTFVMHAAMMLEDSLFYSYLDDAISVYEKRDISDYSPRGIRANLKSAQLIMEAISYIRDRHEEQLSEREAELQIRLPHEALAYIYQAPKEEHFGMLVSNLVVLVGEFRELPGGMEFGEFFLNILVALHPPTYVHSHMVAKLSACLARHLLIKRPELFVGFPGCDDPDRVSENKERIHNYTYRAALFHDIGKLIALDTIAMYGRRLLDTEFALLKTHPQMGGYIADHFESVKEYSDVIRGHHLWYDGTKGYPENFDASVSPYKTIIDIVTVADCMDAATDRVGRSYNTGKTLDDFVKEAEEGAGTRYAPFLAEILRDEDTHRDIKWILEEGRQKVYRETFRTLVGILQKG